MPNNVGYSHDGRLLERKKVGDFRKITLCDLSIAHLKRKRIGQRAVFFQPLSAILLGQTMAALERVAIVQMLSPYLFKEETVPMWLGIDFGTTNTSAAVFDGHKLQFIPLDPQNSSVQNLRFDHLL